MAAALDPVPTWQDVREKFDSAIIAKLEELVGTGPKTAGAKRFFGWVATSETSEAEWMRNYVANDNRDIESHATIGAIRGAILRWVDSLQELGVWKTGSIRAQRDHLLRALEKLREFNPGIFPKIDPRSMPMGAHHDGGNYATLCSLNWPEFDGVEPERRDAIALSVLRNAALEVFERYERIYRFGQNVLSGDCSLVENKRAVKTLRRLIVDEIRSWETIGRSQFSIAWSASLTLREWFAYLGERGVPWNQADDLKLHQWRQHELENGVSPEQVETKLKRVFHFYHHIPDAMVCQPDGTVMPEFVGENRREEPPRFPISTKEVKTKSGHWLTVWSGSKPIKQVKPNLVVLVNDDRDLVLSELRSPSKRKKDLGDIDSIIRCERDWGMGRTMAGAGLRAHEVPALSLLDLTEAMKREQLFRGLGRARAATLRSVAELADEPEAQKVVLKGLKHFTEKRKRLYVGVRVVGKGNKERRAGFTVDLLYDLLTVVVWGGRSVLINRWQAADPDYVPEDTLFLSFKTGKALTEGAVSDIMLKAFIDANVSGSGHDLRKNYATNMAAKILTRNLQLFGYFTHAVLNTVLSEVADALGHAQVNTTTQHYANLAIATATGLENKRQRDKVMRVCDMLLESAGQDMLDDDRIRLCGTAIKVFSEMPKDCELFEILAGAMEETELNPGGLINLSAFGKRVPYLRVVADNTR